MTMPAGILFWILYVLAVIALLTGFAPGGIVVSRVLIFLLLGLLGWKVFGPVLQ